MSIYSEFFLTSRASVVELDLIEISHPSFSMVHRVVRNAVGGITVTLEDSTVADFVYYPLNIKLTGASTDLDQTMEITFGDLGEILPQELDLVSKAGTFTTKPVLIFRSYRSDTLTAPLYGPVTFQIQNIAFNKQGCVLDVTAPKLNQSKTGQIYTFNRFPMLRGF